jgi:hypothetical protein
MAQSNGHEAVTIRSALLLGVVLTLAGCAQLGATGGRTARSSPRTGSADERCAAAAPSTPAGYAAMFSHIPADEWAGGDGGITVPFGPRSIWLFSDTFSARPHGFAHSTAIVQTGGCMHVSHAGGQILPDDADTRAQVSGHAAVIHHIYWIESGHVIDGTHIAITARAMKLVPHWDGKRRELVYGEWDFADGGFDRTALVSVSASGDLTFVRWTATVRAPAPNAGSMLDCEAPAPATPGHFCYARHIHPELRLAGGRLLVTTSQGWDDGKLHPFADYGLVFSES